MSTTSALHNLPSTSTAFTATRKPRRPISTDSKPKPASSGPNVEYVTVAAPTHEVLLIAGRDPEVEVERYDSSAVKLRFIEEARGMPAVIKASVKVSAPVAAVEKVKGKQKEVVQVEDRVSMEKERPRKRPRKQV